MVRQLIRPQLVTYRPGRPVRDNLTPCATARPARKATVSTRRTPDLARMNDPHWTATPRIARTCTLEGGAIADGDPSCFPLRQDDSSRNVSAVCDVERAASSPPAAGRFDVVAQLVRKPEARRSRRYSAYWPQRRTTMTREPEGSSVVPGPSTRPCRPWRSWPRLRPTAILQAE